MEVLVADYTSQHFRIQRAIYFDLFQLFRLVLVTNLNREVANYKVIVGMCTDCSSVK